MIDSHPVARLQKTRTITVLDHVRIFNLLRRQTRRSASDSALFDLIDSAELVSPQDVAPDTVTMLSRVRVASEDGAAAEPREIMLCFPEDVPIGDGRLSILTPAGASLLGLRAGDVAHWTAPDGTRHSTRIIEVLSQPEADGNFIG